MTLRILRNILKSPIPPGFAQSRWGVCRWNPPGGLEREGFEMLKAMMWSMLGLLITASAAQADHFYSPVDYYVAPVAVRPVYSAPIPVGISYAAAPVVVSRPVYVSPVVHTVYAEPVYAAPISTVSYTTTTYAATVIAAPVYVRPAVTLAPLLCHRTVSFASRWSFGHTRRPTGTMVTAGEIGQ